MTEPVIQFQQAGKQYGDSWALHSLTLNINQGEFLSVVGSSGGGKTTLLKLINGLLLPTSGRVLVMGQDTAKVNLIQLRRQIGYVIQGAALFPHMTVADNISYVPGLSGEKLSQARLEELMKLVDLQAELLHRYPISLSGGQQQRVGIARALASKDSIQNLHEQLNTTIVFVTHNIREALRLSDRVLIINHGQIEQLDTPANIQAHPATEYVKRLLR